MRPRRLLDSIEQVVRLIRSKGVGVYFITQNPLDVPETVLGQLGNRVQHALRAFTPRDQRAVRAAAETFRQNPKFSTAEVITQLSVGEALVSMLEGKGTPAIVSRCLIAPPSARVGPLTPQERKQLMDKSALKGKYDDTVDRDSAYEKLLKKAGGGADEDAPVEAGAGGSGGILGKLEGMFGGGAPAPINPKTGKLTRQPQTMTQVIIKSVATSAARSAGTQIARAILRGVLGSMLKR